MSEKQFLWYGIVLGSFIGSNYLMYHIGFSNGGLDALRKALEETRLEIEKSLSERGLL